jgi:hypothetical protein
MDVGTGSCSRLIEAVTHVTGRIPTQREAGDLSKVPDATPQALGRLLADLLPGQFSLTGPLDRRILFAERAPGLDGWTTADLSGQPHSHRVWPDWTHDRIVIDNPESWLSTATLTACAAQRLNRPRVLLTALYHPEWFPLPRFPLAISDLARAARATLLGQIRLMDMQLGVTAEDVISIVGSWQPNIVGVSATFGQHDLMIRLLDHLFALPCPPLVLAGGSLTVRNEAWLLEHYPRLLVARGAGEPTMSDILTHFHGDLAISQVRGIGYAGASRGEGTYVITRRQTAVQPNRAATDFFPELDLLDQTLERQGVAQLESSRGCTSYCSFCPRGHKGAWAGATPEQLPWMLAAMREVFDRHPQISRTLYLVDEEFIGRGEDAVPRALEVGSRLHQAGFAWESSCRIDQVVRPGCGRDWHLERGHMWRQLMRLGLRRMLFGVESGVASILTRFNKETTPEQNVLAIRTLSALGVPTRFTYITFDHLMSVTELRATHAFQARTDLLLRPLPGLSVGQIISGVRDRAFVDQHAVGRPFYTAISYMLVSMECLVGAAYTRSVRAAGLDGEPRPLMGSIDARFADWRIGACSRHAQLWIDRNFALDYTLKSLEKILDGQRHHLVRETRMVIKTAAFAVLTRMLDLIPCYPVATTNPDEFDQALLRIMDEELFRLVQPVSNALAAVLPELPSEIALLLTQEHQRWERAVGWKLINAADPCGT